VLTWIFFRAVNTKQAVAYFSEISSTYLLTLPPPNKSTTLTTLLFIGIFTIFEWLGRDNEYAIEKTGETL